MEYLCELVDISLNKNCIYGDKNAISPSGIRIGTPAMVSRGFDKNEFEQIAIFLDKLIAIGNTVQTNIYINTGGKLLEDFKKTLNLKNGEGEFVEMIKITDMVDLKLAEIWNLHDSYKFAEQHKEKLQGLKEFYIQKLKWKYTETGELKLAQPLMPDELFYEKEDKLNRDGEVTGSSYSFNYEYAYNFLRNRGFWKIRMANGELSFVEIRNRTIKMVDNYYIRDFATNFAKTSIKSTDRNKYMNMIYRGGAKYFGPDSLKFMDEFVPVL
jgi:hypothetical protein